MPDPHLLQQLSRMGAKVVFHAVNGGRDGGETSRVAWWYHESNLRLRAMAGKLWIVTVDSCEPVTLPCSAPSGVINPRGSVLPIVDLAERLGFPQTDASARQVIIVVQVGAQIIGLLVDAVSDILTLTTETIQPTPEVASAFVKFFVRGMLAIDGRMIGVIELDSIMLAETEEAA